MKKHTFKVSLLAAAVGLASAPAMATDVRIDGFASLVYGQTLDRNEGETFDGKYGPEANYQSDSVYGIQFRADLSEGLSATAQLLGKGAENFDAKIAWAYFAYQLNDNFTVKAGRQRLPYFLYSDFLDVGYAYHWIAPPSAVYELGGFDNLDGINLEYYGEWGPVTSRINLIAGATTTEAGDFELATEDNWVASWNMNWNWLTFQITYSESSVTIGGINTIADGIDQIYSGAIAVPPLSALGVPPLTSSQIDSLNMENDRGHFGGVGLSADLGSWFAAAEYTDVGVADSPLTSEKTSWYVAGGFRTGKFTYSITYSQVDNPNNPDTVATLTDDISPFAPGTNVMTVLAGAAANTSDSFGAYSAQQLVDAVNNVLMTGYESESYNLTMRYDFHPSAAFKFDYTQEKTDYSDVNGNITKREPALVRMGVDLVF